MGIDLVEVWAGDIHASSRAFQSSSFRDVCVMFASVLLFDVRFSRWDSQLILGVFLHFGWDPSIRLPMRSCSPFPSSLKWFDCRSIVLWVGFVDALPIFWTTAHVLALQHATAIYFQGIIFYWNPSNSFIRSSLFFQPPSTKAQPMYPGSSRCRTCGMDEEPVQYGIHSDISQTKQGKI